MWFQCKTYKITFNNEIIAPIVEGQFNFYKSSFESIFVMSRSIIIPLDAKQKASKNIVDPIFRLGV